MKIIVTGGDGFIGKALTAALLRRGDDVIVVDLASGIEAGEYFSPRGFITHVQDKCCGLQPPSDCIHTLKKSPS